MEWQYQCTNLQIFCHGECEDETKAQFKSKVIENVCKKASPELVLNLGLGEVYRVGKLDINVNRIVIAKFNLINDKH